MKPCNFPAKKLKRLQRALHRRENTPIRAKEGRDLLERRNRIEEEIISLRAKISIFSMDPRSVRTKKSRKTRSFFG